MHPPHPTTPLQLVSHEPEITDSSFSKAVNFSSACTTKRFPSPRCVSAIQIAFARWNQSPRPSPTPPGFAEIVSDDFPVLHAHLSAVNIFWSPGQPEITGTYYPLIAAVTGPHLNLCATRLFAAYSKNWPLPRSMARGPSPTLKIVFSPRRVIV